VGWTCRFTYVFIHFFDGFIVNYRFASAFIPESKADVNAVGGLTHLSDQAQFDTPTREDRRESPSERGGSVWLDRCSTPIVIRSAVAG
jgi:hypothetical protein